MTRISLAGIMLLTVVLGPAPAALGQPVIFLIRHAEQTPDQEPVLTEAGQRRAARLARQLKDAGISAIYVTDAVRTRETAAPVAQALGITPRVVGRQGIEGLAARVRAEHPQGRVLIVNHALNIAGLLRAFGHPEGVPVAVNDYEPLLVIVPRPDGPPTVIFLRQ